MNGLETMVSIFSGMNIFNDKLFRSVIMETKTTDLSDKHDAMLN